MSEYKNGQAVAIIGEVVNLYGQVGKRGELISRYDQSPEVWKVKVYFEGTQSDEFSLTEEEFAPVENFGPQPELAPVAPPADALPSEGDVPVLPGSPLDQRLLAEAKAAFVKAGDDGTREAILPTLLSGINPDAKTEILAAYIQARENTLQTDLAAARKAVNAVLVHQSDEAARYEAELATARSRIAALEAALEPFVKDYHRWLADDHEETYAAFLERTRDHDNVAISAAIGYKLLQAKPSATESDARADACVKFLAGVPTEALEMWAANGATLHKLLTNIYTHGQEFTLTAELMSTMGIELPDAAQ